MGQSAQHPPHLTRLALQVGGEHQAVQAKPLGVARGGARRQPIATHHHVLHALHDAIARLESLRHVASHARK